MNKKLIFVALLSLCQGVYAFPAKILPLEAVYAANTYLEWKYPDSTFTISNVVTFPQKGDHPLLYEVITMQGQSLLLSASRACIPILADYQYPESSLIKEFESGDLPCNLAALIDSYVEQIDSSFSNNNPSAYYVSIWDSLIAGQMYKVSSRQGFPSDNYFMGTIYIQRLQCKFEHRGIVFL